MSAGDLSEKKAAEVIEAYLGRMEDLERAGDIRQKMADEPELASEMIKCVISCFRLVGLAQDTEDEDDFATIVSLFNMQALADRRETLLMRMSLLGQIGEYFEEGPLSGSEAAERAVARIESIKMLVMMSI